MRKIIIFAFSVISLAVSGFAQEKEAKGLKNKLSAMPAAQEISVMAFKVKKVRNFRETIPILGTIVPSGKIEFKFPEKGVVKKVYVHEGDDVNEGDTLAELEDKEFILRMDYAKNKYASENSLLGSMEKSYTINEALFDKGLLLKAKLDELALKVEAQKHKAESAKNEWELAEDSLSKIKLISNCKGKVDKREIEEGELVSPETKAITVLRIDKVFAEVGITQKDISKVKMGQRAEIKVDAYPKEFFRGAVKNILPSIKGSSRTLTLRIEIDNARYDYKLLPGMFLRGDVVLAEFNNVYVVPTDALLSLTPRISTAYLVNTDKKFSKKELEEGNVKGKIALRKVNVLYRGAEYSCVEGLSPGSFIITRSEGDLLPNATGRIVHVEEYEE